MSNSGRDNLGESMFHGTHGGEVEHRRGLFAVSTSGTDGRGHRGVGIRPPADGSLRPNREEILSIVEAQVAGLVDLAIKIESYTRAGRSG